MRFLVENYPLRPKKVIPNSRPASDFFEGSAMFGRYVSYKSQVTHLRFSKQRDTSGKVGSITL